MNILITGATGFVGQHLVNELITSSKYTVYCVVRNVARSRKILGGNVNLLVSDDLTQLQHIELDAVVHLASFLTSSDDSAIIDKLIDANIVFGVKLLDALKNHKGLKFINFGSFSEFRSGTEKPEPAYLYAASKRAFHPFLEYYASLSDWDYIHLIPYTIYGGVNNQKKLIDYVRESLDSHSPVLMSPGMQVSDFIHVDDVVSCVLFFLDNLQKWDGQKDEEYHLGTGVGTTIRQLASMFEELSSRKCNIQWGARPYRERDVMYAVAPIDKLKLIGWEPRITLKEGIKANL